jgi:sulfonate transport system substrate-binding protein
MRVLLSISTALSLSCSGSENQSSASPSKASDPRAVRIGYQRAGPPFLLKSRARGLEQKLRAANATLEWIEFQSGPPILEAMRAGAVDVGYVGETPPIFGQAGGVPFVYAAAEPPAPHAEAVLVPKDSPLKTLADLKGQRVALNRGSNVHYLLVKALESAHLTLTDIEFVALAPPDARAAFDHGRIAAWVIWEPYLSAAELAGARVLHDGEGIVAHRFFYLARRDFAVAQAEHLQIVLDAFREVGSWTAEHRGPRVCHRRRPHLHQRQHRLAATARAHRSAHRATPCRPACRHTWRART